MDNVTNRLMSVCPLVAPLTLGVAEPFYEETPTYAQLFYDEGLADVLYDLKWTPVNQRADFRKWWTTT